MLERGVQLLEIGQPAVNRTFAKPYARPSCCKRNFTGARHTGTQASSTNLEMCQIVVAHGK